MQTYTPETWAQYSREFISITTSYQLDIYRDVAQRLVGHVADYGCGAAKVAPYILEQSEVKSYTGVDASEEMLRCGEDFLSLQSSSKDYHFIHSSIHKLQPMVFDSGISINSYYTWEQTESCLTSIYNTLSTGATFVLITPNPSINMEKLLCDVKKELAAHPDFKKFCEINQQLVSADERSFASMSDLIQQCLSTGFYLIEAHQRFYDGGLNYLELKKQSN